MGKGRLEAFSDGVLAVIITIMVLELRAPHGHEWADLVPLITLFLSYLLSFIFLGIYWKQSPSFAPGGKACQRRGPMGEPAFALLVVPCPLHDELDGREPFRGAAGGPVRGGAVVRRDRLHHIGRGVLIKHHGKDSDLAKAMGRVLKEDKKGILSTVAYFVAIPAAFLDTRISGVLYVAVAIMWLVPDTRIERVMAKKDGEG